jgi:hypothetical protein
LLDFNDITVDKDGRVLVAYTDGCAAGSLCVTDPTNNHPTAVDMVMRQTSGDGLFGPGTPVVPEAPVALLIPVAGLALLLLARAKKLRSLIPAR